MRNPNLYWDLYRQAKDGKVVIPKELTDESRKDFLKHVEYELQSLAMMRDALMNRQMGSLLNETIPTPEITGKLLPVPVDIGDAVFMESRGKILQYVVDSFVVDKYGITYCAYCEEHEHHITIPEEWIGERVFFTEKEAVDDATKWAAQKEPLDNQVQSAECRISSQTSSHYKPMKTFDR